MLLAAIWDAYFSFTSKAVKDIRLKTSIVFIQASAIYLLKSKHMYISDKIKLYNTDILSCQEFTTTNVMTNHEFYFFPKGFAYPPSSSLPWRRGQCLPARHVQCNFRRGILGTRIHLVIAIQMFDAHCNFFSQGAMLE